MTLKIHYIFCDTSSIIQKWRKSRITQREKSVGEGRGGEVGDENIAQNSSIKYSPVDPSFSRDPSLNVPRMDYPKIYISPTPTLLGIISYIAIFLLSCVLDSDRNFLINCTFWALLTPWYNLVLSKGTQCFCSFTAMPCVSIVSYILFLCYFLLIGVW